MISRPRLASELQTKYSVTTQAPPTLAALLSSFQTGFSTRAIEKRTSEVRQALGATTSLSHPRVAGSAGLGNQSVPISRQLFSPTSTPCFLAAALMRFHAASRSSSVTSFT
ncbi:MAG: hypothetical protein EOP13_00490 [Pseudomonas sp.]|nr:MAG: hypothetical protein EOP13_00490 [Pseudomonas sp.]